MKTHGGFQAQAVSTIRKKAFKKKKHKKTLISSERCDVIYAADVLSHVWLLFNNWV